MRELRDDAVVLRTYRSGESDRVVVLWTREHGKVRALAKGSRKPVEPARRRGSRRSATCASTSWRRAADFYVAAPRRAPRRDWPPLRSSLRPDQRRLRRRRGRPTPSRATDVADEGIFELLTRVLETLDDERYRPALVPAAFALRLLAHDGSAPVLDECVSCGRTGPLVAFDASAGGALCAACRTGRSVSRDALALLRRLVGGGLGAALPRTTRAGAGEVAAIAAEAMEAHFGACACARRAPRPASPARSVRRRDATSASTSTSRSARTAATTAPSPRTPTATTSWTTTSTPCSSRSAARATPASRRRRRSSSAGARRRA